MCISIGHAFHGFQTGRQMIARNNRFEGISLEERNSLRPFVIEKNRSLTFVNGVPPSSASINPGFIGAESRDSRSGRRATDNPRMESAMPGVPSPSLRRSLWKDDVGGLCSPEGGDSGTRSLDALSGLIELVKRNRSNRVETAAGLCSSGGRRESGLRDEASSSEPSLNRA